MYYIKSDQYLVLTHAMTGVNGDSLACHVVIWRIVVKAVVDHASVFKLQLGEEKKTL